MVLYWAEVDDMNAAESRRSVVTARDTGLGERVDGIAGEVRRSDARSEEVGVVCGSRSASERLGRVTTKGDCQHILFCAFATMVNGGSQAMVLDILVVRTFVRGLPAALTSVTRKAWRQVVAYLRPAE